MIYYKTTTIIFLAIYMVFLLLTKDYWHGFDANDLIIMFIVLLIPIIRLNAVLSLLKFILEYFEE